MATSQNTENQKFQRMQRLSNLLTNTDPEVVELAKELLGKDGYTVETRPDGSINVASGKASKPGELINLSELPSLGSGPLTTGRLREDGMPTNGGLSLSQENEIRNSLPKGPIKASQTSAPTSLSSAPGASGRSAYSIGAPSMNDSVDAFGRVVPGAQSFVRGLFASANTAESALRDYKKLNPTAAASDPQFQALQNSYTQALTDAQAGAKWAAMAPSQRQAILQNSERAAMLNNAGNASRSYANELLTAQQDQGSRPTNLLEDLDYYNQTGVMRGGAGVGTSTTPGGGVISQTSPTTRTLQSPYGTGSFTLLTPEQQATRPEGLIGGQPASKFFDDAARRQGTTFSVGGVQYSPDNYPAPAPGETQSDYAKRQLNEAKSRAELERRKFANTLMR